MNHISNVVLTLFFLVICGQANAQEENRQFLDDFRGTASITNNGISLIPSFSLGDPALLFDLKFTKGRVSFEPDMRFPLEGKPWSFLFWFRYKAIQKEKFSLRLGAHPALNFRTVSIIRNGQAEELLESRRYLAVEIVPTYKISEKTSIGMYYLRGQGFDEGIKQTNFLVLNSSFINLLVSEHYYFNITPQVYFLKIDDLKGYYVAGFFTFAKKDFPLSISAIVNKVIDTEIVPEDDFTWNISLNYSFPNPNRNLKKRL
ncbi:hypothetical protein SAMN05421636_1226 [Pricia antarctica]|uniref:Outer membrane protein beta-barrel domain-containing protein n=1 Tax=Pricia antarctica TaxID=641691 RepID=A0A1G7JC13_9FLAO|nr:hypothetical protein [Pricia antarctica]SDF22482.1 hypothetical protein SAMN05421636_1226 [Pricia antarctica]